MSTRRDITSTARALRPRNWALWRRPPKFIVFVLVTGLSTVGWLGASLANAPWPSALDWLRFAILTAGATVHIQMTKRQEERRRNRGGLLIDLTATWVVPAAIILPVPLIILVVGLVRLQRWFIARRPAHNFIYSTVMHMFSATVAHQVFVALGPGTWGAISPWSALIEFGHLALAGLTYEVPQMLFIGGAIALSAPGKAKLSNSLGNKADNLLEAITIGLGTVTAVLLVVLPPAVAIMAVVTVVFNRLAELDQLQDDVRTDPKTQVFNMRGWTESAERALARAVKASGQGLAVLMIDLDHFKWINDTYGHPAGDDVLHNLAQLLNEVTRPSDVVGRFGGEEFLILLPETGQAGAAGTGERIRSAVAGLRITTTDKRGEMTTIIDRTASIGVAVYPDHGTSLETLMQAADAAVYEAKEGGRNQVRIAGRRRAGSGWPPPPSQPDHLPH